MKSRSKWSTPRGPGGHSCPCCTPGAPRSWKRGDRRAVRRAPVAGLIAEHMATHFDNACDAGTCAECIGLTEVA